jgi:TatA/E family protein of Tat protein translocase
VPGDLIVFKWRRSRVKLTSNKRSQPEQLHRSECSGFVTAVNQMQLAFFSPVDMMIIMALALVVFGPKRLPEVGRQLGEFMREARKMLGQITDAAEDVHQEFKPLRDIVQPRPVTLSGDKLMLPYDQRDPAKPVVSVAVQPQAATRSFSTLPPLAVDPPEQDVSEFSTVQPSEKPDVSKEE